MLQENLSTYMGYFQIRFNKTENFEPVWHTIFLLVMFWLFSI